jgi:hypothetical protein
MKMLKLMEKKEKPYERRRQEKLYSWEEIGIGPRIPVGS